MRRLFRLWRLGGHDLRVLFVALRHPNRPPWLIPAVMILALFALEPFNFAVPSLGIVDDLFVLPLLLRVLAKFAATSIGSRVDRSGRDDRVVSVQ
jgi:uncharacterized membrane protein YkvA (DUF1232 family)